MATRTPNDIYQFSTVSALISGLSSGGPSASDLIRYGTLGLGTLTELNGEILLLDGEAWHMTTTSIDEHGDTKTGHQTALNEEARGLAPVIRPCDPDAHLPFVQVTNFIPEFTIPYSSSSSSSLSKTSLSTVVATHTSTSGGPNSFIPFRIKGTFKKISVRIAGPKKSPDEALVAVTSRAPQWTLHDIKGTLAGVLSPEWSNGISVAGFHGHFIEDDGSSHSCDGKKGRRGGHVLDFQIEEGQLEWGVCGRWHLGMPRGREWEEADLRVQADGIKKAEG